VYHVARVVLQSATPLSIGTGETDGVFDNLLVRDANGLPTIPGSSLAGVLRHLYWRVHESDKKEDEATQTNRLFGQAKKRKAEASQAQEDNDEAQTESPSLLNVSWGFLHSREDVPVEGLQPDIADSKDEVIQDALQTIPIKRDHVKLNHRGASDAAKQGKFDRVSLTKGHRFSVELSLWGTLDDEMLWNKVLALLKRPDFRLGGGTRRGLGKLELIRCYQGYFKLGETDARNGASEFERFSRLNTSLADTTELRAEPLPEASHSLESIILHLQPETEGYRFGGGNEPLDTSADEQNAPDFMPVTEPVVAWNNTGCITQRQLVIPASSIKGALSHRTAYHYNRLSGRHSDKQPGEPDDAYQKRMQDYLDNSLAVRILFGYVDPKTKGHDEEIAHIGCVIFDDLHLDKDYQRSLQIAHNGIDRFTGGVRESVLFSEEVVTHSQSWPALTLTLTLSRAQLTKLDRYILPALQCALDDLTKGRLSLGAGGGRGAQGYFNGDWAWGGTDHHEA
ncbi:MAG: RAMP superfamily CRISPR-associated protein, partial [Blastocatellia bacterium]